MLGQIKTQNAAKEIEVQDNLSQRCSTSLGIIAILLHPTQVTNRQYGNNMVVRQTPHCHFQRFVTVRCIAIPGEQQVAV